MYLPLGLWKCLATHPATEGPRGGRLLTFGNVGRKLNNSEFVTMVANAWIGTTAPQSALLEPIIRSVVETGKTITLAVKTGDTRFARQRNGDKDLEGNDWQYDFPDSFDPEEL